MELQKFITQKRSQLAGCLTINNPVNSKRLTVIHDPSALGHVMADNPVNSRVSDDGKSVRSFLGMLAWIILD